MIHLGVQKSDVPPEASRFEISVRTLGTLIEIFVIFPASQGKYRDISGFDLRLVRAGFMVAKVDRESFLLKCSLFLHFQFHSPVLHIHIRTIHPPVTLYIRKKRQHL